MGNKPFLVKMPDKPQLSETRQYLELSRFVVTRHSTLEHEPETQDKVYTPIAIYNDLTSVKIDNFENSFVVFARNKD